MNIPRRAILSLAVATLLAGCRISEPWADAPSNQPRLVLLYAPCTVNKRFLSPYNPRVRYTPHLEAFAREAAVFTRHRTEASLSGIAYASLLTGHQATGHGVFAHPTTLVDTVYDITEAFAQNGYDVFFWNDQRMGAADLNYGQGVPPENTFTRLLKSDDQRFRAIIDRLSDEPQYKAFVLVNFRVNHNPYRLDHLNRFLRDHPSELRDLKNMSRQEFQKFVQLYYEEDYLLRYDFERARQEQNLSDEDVTKLSRVIELLYKSNIPVLDRLFGETVAAVDDAGLGDDAMIVFTADHGESMYRPHAPFKWSHGHALQADVLDVPLMIRGADSPMAAGQYGLVTRSIDVFPTLVACANLRLPEDVQPEGFDIAERLNGNNPRDLLAFSHTGMILPPFERPYKIQKLMGKYLARFYPESNMNLTWVALRSGDTVWKYRRLENGEFGFQAFDLERDPGESRNVYDAADPRHQAMARRLRQYKEALVEAYRHWSAARVQAGLEPTDREQLRRLRELGYVQ